MMPPIYFKVIFAITCVTRVFGDLGDFHTNHHINPHDSKTALNWTLNFVTANKYPIETHYITTEDGYILKMYRIPRSPFGKLGGPPVLLHHGFIGCSADWVVLGPGRGLGFVLADGGYDVWMTNSRGSTESKSHIKLKSSDKAFWDFSWHEIGYYDIPAEIDYILDRTGRASLSYVGFSMGATAYMVMGATKPQYVAKVNAMIALGPVAFMQHVQGLALRYLAPLASHMEWLVRLIGGDEFLPTSDFMTWAAKRFCKDDTVTQRLCSNILFLLYGFQNPTLNGTCLARIFEFTPAGGSTKEFLHFAQLINHAPVFRHYDYGYFSNWWKYGRSTPPPYDLYAVRSPVHVFMSNNDWFAGNMDVLRLVSQLPNTPTIRLVKRQTFNHFDFIYADDAPVLVYEDVIKILEKIQY